MYFYAFRRILSRLAALALCAAALAGVDASAQQPRPRPLTNAEFLSLVRQLPHEPGLKEQLVEEIRRRGIGFRLSSGLRSFVATKSGNDEELRRVLEEAERRLVNPREATPLPSEAETSALLARARAASIEATEQMPDFVVKQLITRSYALGSTRNWKVSDRLIVGVSYRVSEGEKYRLLAINGIEGAVAEERSDYKEAGGTHSTGEFVTTLRALFDEKGGAEFKPHDTETLRGRRAVVYTYEVKKPDSQWVIESGGGTVVSAHRGRVWVDRERARVLRVEKNSYGLPATFPLSAATITTDYDWVKIPGQGEYLLPARSLVLLTRAERGQTVQFRNEISFRSYQKYGTELRILDDDIIDEEVPAETPPPPPPQKKP